MALRYDYQESLWTDCFRPPSFSSVVVSVIVDFGLRHDQGGGSPDVGLREHLKGGHGGSTAADDEWLPEVKSRVNSGSPVEEETWDIFRISHFDTFAGAELGGLGGKVGSPPLSGDCRDLLGSQPVAYPRHAWASYPCESCAAYEDGLHLLVHSAPPPTVTETGLFSSEKING